MSDTYPFEIANDFTKSPNCLRKLYSYYPEFTGNTIVVYEILLARYNSQMGYAWPTIWQIALESAQSESGVKRQLRILKKVGLLAVGKSEVARNNTYVPLAPISDEHEFWRKYPEAKAAYDKHRDTLKKSEKLSKGRWAAKKE